MESAEVALFERNVRRALETHQDEALDAALGALGWIDALGHDRASAIAVLFVAQGITNATSSAFDWLLAHALIGNPHTATAVILPRLQSTAAPGETRDGRCLVHGLSTRAITGAETAVAVMADDSGHWVFEIEAAALQRRPLSGIDPALGLVEVTGEIPLSSGQRRELVDWDGAIALGQLALSHELVGAARTMLDLAREHALGRIQFGRPIAAFQAVRHRLADSLVAIEGAAAFLDAAWDDPTPRVAAMAKGISGRAARTVSRHCQQVLAGIGFTTEHPFHRYVRRTVVLDQLFGAGRTLSHDLGVAVLATWALPPQFPL